MKLEEYLMGNKLNFLLKYDAPRDKNKYTVLFYDVVQMESIYAGDVSSAKERLEAIAYQDSTMPIETIMETIYQLFIKAKEQVQNFEETVLVLATKYNLEQERLTYVFSVSSKEANERHIFKTYTELESFIITNY